MRRLGIVALGLALVMGIVVGGMLGNPFGRSASASTATQAREDQITIFADGESRCGTGGDVWGPLLPLATPRLLVLDPRDYPPSPVFRFEALIEATSPGTHCVRLFDTTADAPVAGGEVCYRRTGLVNEQLRLRSDPLTLTGEEHVYTVQGKAPDLSSSWPVAAARIIVEWTESPYAVGGIGELPALAGPAGTSGMGGATYAVLAGAAAGVLAFAVLATLAVKRRGVR